jgi:LysR family glycine cleavage system transcriptional activator
MKNPRLSVPSLNALAVFEVAGRLGGFSHAARELRISQPAVTRHVRGLEEAVGLTLFDRSHNRARLTEPGLRLWQAVHDGLEDIAAVLRSLKQEGGNAPFVVSTHAGFGQQWLMPRLEDLRAALGGRPISLSIVDRASEFDDLVFDIGVRHGHRDRVGPRAIQLAAETVLPVIGASMAEQRPELLHAPAERLVDEPLIHMDEGDRPWMTWFEWFRLVGVKRPPPMAAVRLNHYPLVMAEVLDGTGIGLGWRPLVDGMLQAGILVAVGPEARRPDWGWWLVWGETTPEVDVDRARAWFASRFPDLP